MSVLIPYPCVSNSSKKYGRERIWTAPLPNRIQHRAESSGDRIAVARRLGQIVRTESFRAQRGPEFEARVRFLRRGHPDENAKASQQCETAHSGVPPFDRQRGLLG